MARLVVVDNKVAIVKNIINGVLHTDTLEPIRISEKEIFYVNDGVFGKYFTEDLDDEVLAYALTIIVQDNAKNKDNLLMYVDLDEVDEDLSVVDRFDGITTSEFLEELLGAKVTKSQSSDIADMIESTRQFALGVVANMTSGVEKTMLFDESLDIVDIANDITENLLNNEVSINCCDTACIVGYDSSFVHYVNSESLFNDYGMVSIMSYPIDKLDVHALYDLSTKIENI